MAQYLKEDNFCYSVKEKQKIFASRMADLDVKANLAIYQSETQEHIIQCEVLIKHN